jgi:FkbM family methyltransferase
MLRSHDESVERPRREILTAHRCVLLAVRLSYFVQTRLLRIRYRKLWAFLERKLASKPAQMVMPGVGCYAFDLLDGYWNRLAVREFTYEPEVARVLMALRASNWLFVDCGANFGYWSIVASSPAMGSKPTVAVEASSASYTNLVHNADLNGGRFVTLRRAIAERGGQLVAFSLPSMDTLAGHSARHVVLDVPDADRVEMVETVTIDDVVEDCVRRFDERPEGIVVKLDVEGNEIAALLGAQRVLRENCLLLYEDHGSDSAHAVTNYLWRSTGMRVFHVASETGIRRVESSEDLDRIKVDIGVGYNFVGCDPQRGLCREFIRALGGEGLRPGAE